MPVYTDFASLISFYDLRYAWARLHAAREAGMLASSEVDPALRVLEKLMDVVMHGTPKELRP